MNMSISGKSSEIILNQVIYSMHILYACIWKCQSLANDVCKEQMPHCKFQSEMSEAVKVAKLFCNKLVFQSVSQNRCTLPLEFFCKWKIGAT